MEPTNQTNEDPIVAGVPMDEEDEPVVTPKEPVEKVETKVEPPAPAPKKEDEKPPEPPKKDEIPPKKEDVPPADDKGKPERPEKYIPIKQYTDEKKATKEALDAKDARIKELEGIQGQKTTEGLEDAIKAYAEKHKVDPESVRELAEIFGGKAVSKEAKAELPPEALAEIEEARNIKANQLFGEEFDSLAVPQIKEFFPDANPEQLKEAKAELEKLALTKPYLDKSLDYIVFKEKAELGKIFEVRKGAESTREAPKKTTELSADDFKDGKNFAELDNLPAEERNKIVKDFDMPTWSAYKHYVRSKEELDD